MIQNHFTYKHNNKLNCPGTLLVYYMVLCNLFCEYTPQNALHNK